MSTAEMRAFNTGRTIERRREGIEEAIRILRELRAEVVNHPELSNDWLITDTIDEVVALLEGRPES